MPKPKKHVLVCVQGRPEGHPRGSCQAKGCGPVWQKFSDEFATRKLWESGLQLTNTGCLGPCHLGPSVLVYPDGVMYTGVTPDDVDTIIDQHLLFNEPVERLMAPADVW
jgi:(2Fe-2S) ferredoxin